MFTRRKMLGLVVCAMLVTTLTGQKARADAKAQGYYGLGVSIGMAEFASGECLNGGAANRQAIDIWRRHADRD